ncbi:hypothetical protein GCM10022200_21060 [Microbacterium awajiense]|uniref:Uncharacterized protein n=1 Tax=Microbacterium awajiense TaxID=415214 RepID=A0ABP7APS9_9MICO
MRHLTKAALGIAAGVGLVLGMTTPASALVDYSYRVVNASKSTYYTNFGQVVGSCKALTTGTTCTISKGKTATRTIGTSLGYTRSGVAASLNMSSASSVTISVSCTSPVLKAGQTFYAYPVGDRWSYRIKKDTIYSYTNTGTIYKTTTEYSNYLTAFNPYASSIACRVG